MKDMKSIKREIGPTVFFGTPRFAVQVLDALEKEGVLPDVVVTAPDRPAGRGLLLQAPPVKDWALERDIPALQPENFKQASETLTLLKNSEWNLFLVAAYGTILPKDILALPQKGALNVHPSLLPKFRGASPIESQILADEKTVGVTIMLMDEKMDHGPILSQASVTPEDLPAQTKWPLKASVLETMLATVGGELLAETIPAWLSGSIKPEEQKHDEATFTKKIERADGLIEVGGRPTSAKEEYEKYLKYCAYDGWPGVYFLTKRNGGEMRVKITDAEYKNGAFAPRKVIPEGKKEIGYQEFLNAASSSSLNNPG